MLPKEITSLLLCLKQPDYIIMVSKRAFFPDSSVRLFFKGADGIEKSSLL